MRAKRQRAADGEPERPAPFDAFERRVGILAAQLDQAGAEAAAGIEHGGARRERNALREAAQRTRRRREDRRVVPGAHRIDDREQRQRQQPRPRRQRDAAAGEDRERERKAAADEDASPRRRADQRERRADEAGGDEGGGRWCAELRDRREDDPARGPRGEGRQRPAAVDEAASFRPAVRRRRGHRRVDAPRPLLHLSIRAA